MMRLWRVSDSGDARAALARSTQELLASWHQRQDAARMAEDLRQVERRNHLVQSIQEAFKEKR